MLILGSFSHIESHHSIWFSFCRVRTRRFPSSTVQKESSTMIVLVRLSLTIRSLPLSPILSLFLFITTFRSRPRVLSGSGTVTESSDRVCVQTYFSSTVPPLPMGGGESSFSSSSPSSFDLTGAATSSVGRAAGLSSSFAGGLLSFTAGDSEMSNPPSASSSIISSSTLTFPAFFFFSAASFFFLFASSFFATSSSFFFLSLK
mmetsp:Transcript_36964/g.66499  ORF Transcript_36964/g.66499 Transcript_36964/m.66499 type:complete len:203 (-) Transcript_36964:313-921(-)